MKKLRPNEQEQSFMNVLLEHRYTAQNIIARGGMGTVFFGVDSMLNRKVAIKLLQASMDSEALVRFQREAAIISSFSHPNLVQLYSHGTHKGFTYLVLEFVPGKSLSDILAQGRLSVQASVELGICVCAALIEAHSAAVIHRDLKPGNILVEQKGDHVNAKLVDFGVAYTVSDGTRLTSAGAICGTPGYIAPEQIAGIDVTNKCDLYSLGVVLFECLTGKRAFEGTNPIAVLIRQTQHSSPSLKNYSALKLPAKLERLVSDLVRKEPEGRPQSAQQVLQTLKEIQESLSHDSDDLRQTVPLQAITRQQVERSLSMPIRVGGGWDELLGDAPGISYQQPIDPQVFDPNPNMIDISFEFGHEGLLSDQTQKRKITPKPPQAIRREKVPLSNRDFSKLELEIVDRGQVAERKLPRDRSSMKPWMQFVLVMLLSMAVTFGLVYFFMERDAVVDHIPKTKNIPSMPQKGLKPRPPKEWKRIQGM